MIATQMPDHPTGSAVLTLDRPGSPIRYRNRGGEFDSRKSDRHTFDYGPTTRLYEWHGFAGTFSGWRFPVEKRLQVKKLLRIYLE